MNWELEILHLVNTTWTSDFLDHFFLAITNLHKVDWIRFGVFPAVLVWILWRSRMRAWRGILVVIIGLVISDNICHRVFKPVVGRDRPFVAYPNDIKVSFDYRPGGLSFPSNHASNLTAVSTLITWYAPWSVWMLAPIVAVVVYSRAYLGVHYPTDLLAGIVFGWMLASLIKFIIRKYLPSWGPKR